MLKIVNRAWRRLRAILDPELRWQIAQEKEKEWWLWAESRWGALSKTNQNRRQFALADYLPTFREWVGLSQLENRVIDIGCGPCGIGAYIEDAEEVIGLDPLINWYSEHVDYNDLGYSSVVNSPFPIPVDSQLHLGRFDLIICTNTLDHASDPIAFLKALGSIAWNRSRLYLAYDNRYKATELHPSTVSCEDVVDVLQSEGWFVLNHKPISNPKVEPNTVHKRMALSAIRQWGPVRSIVPKAEVSYKISRQRDDEKEKER